MGTRLETYARYKILAEHVGRGRTIRETAEAFGVSDALVCRACERMGVIPRAKQGEGRRLSTKTYRIIAAILRGERYIATAKREGTSLAYVSKIASDLRSAGVDVPTLKTNGSTK